MQGQDKLKFVIVDHNTLNISDYSRLSNIDCFNLWEQIIRNLFIVIFHLSFFTNLALWPCSFGIYFLSYMESKWFIDWVVLSRHTKIPLLFLLFWVIWVAELTTLTSKTCHGDINMTWVKYLFYNSNSDIGWFYYTGKSFKFLGLNFPKCFNNSLDELTHSGTQSRSTIKRAFCFLYLGLFTFVLLLLLLYYSNWVITYFQDCNNTL